MTDILDAIKLKASQYPEVAQGTSCTQNSFKRGKKAFLFAGEQGGRYKVMIKLKRSIAEAQKLADAEPENFQVGKPPWVTIRFSNEDPVAADIWERWLDESYDLSV
ncbi:MAG: MmcQ/YjbR family DNA-binding protein [Pseudomonadota bacterium]